MIDLQSKHGRGCIYVLCLFCIGALYLHYGASQHLFSFYSEQNRELRQNQRMLRPIYAQLQRELVKSRLHMDFTLDNIDLIINFAQINAQTGQGVLTDEVKLLLQAVLRSIPQQITALNLLAIDAYKAEDFSQAVAYWQKILDYADKEHMCNEYVGILREKVVQTSAKAAQFESTPTNIKK